MNQTRDANAALDRLLALRPEDLDGWEQDAAAEADARAEEEALDALFADVLSGWAGADLGAPDLTGTQIRRRASAAAKADAPAVQHGHPRSTRTAPAWLAPAALAASLAVLGFASWQWQPEDPGLKSLVTAQEATRVHLQFAVERVVNGHAMVEPGRDGAQLDGADSINLRVGVEGGGGYISLFEVDASQRTQLLYPLDGRPQNMEAGTRRVQSADGADLVYRPDQAGTYQFIALVTDEPIDATMNLQGVLEAGESRPDLWPRHVLSVDGFTATWSE